MSYDPRCGHYLCLSLDPRCGASCIIQPPDVSVVQPFIDANAKRAGETPPSCSSIRIIPHAKGEPRVETGAVQFGDDWPGLFIRGDDAGALAFQLELVIEALKKHDAADFFMVNELEGYIRLIRGDVIVK